MSYFGEIDSTGRGQEGLPSGWEEARKVTSILVDAVTPKDGYTAEHAVEVARLSRLVGMDLGLNDSASRRLSIGRRLRRPCPRRLPRPLHLLLGPPRDEPSSRSLVEARY